MNTNLSPTKQALLEKWRQGESTGNSTRIPRRPSATPIPISFPQRRQLFLELLSRGTAVNNLSIFLEIRGNLDLAALEQSANKIIARHDILRTRFLFDKGLLTPEVSSKACITLATQDLQRFNPEEQMAIARAEAEREVLIPFDLTQTPLIRARLYILSKQKYLLLIIAHHTIADGWSLGVFLNELTMFYREVTTGKFSADPELAIQYADFAHWQTGENIQNVLQNSMEYWKKQLAGELPILEIPTDRPRNTRQTFSGGTQRFTISKNVTQALEKLGRDAEATLFMTVLTTFYILLHRYGGQDEIIVGSPISNRNDPDLQSMIGVFINTLALRVDLSGDPSFREMLKRVRKICLDAYAQQDLPFEKLVEELKPQRDLNRAPVFQVVFNLQNSPMPTPELPGIEIDFLDLDRGVSQFDLTLMISKSEGQCRAIVEYSSDLFNAATVSRMFESFQILTGEIIKHPDKPISTLEVMSKEQYDQLIFKLNETKLDFPRNKCLHELFEAQVKHTPDTTAVIYQNDSLTYSDLNERANILANHLKTRGVKAETRVGILMDRSIEIVEALLAVVKAGGTYVPIHTSFPTERVQFICSDANVQVLITNKDDLTLVDEKIQVVNLNDDLPAGNCCDLQEHISPSRLAYIIYTSGSTGKPKGVMVRHSSLVNFLWSMRQRPGITKESILLSVTPLSFDIAALELFLPIIVGGTVVIASQAMTSNPVMIAEAINRYDVNMMQATPVTWQLLLDTGWQGQPGLEALCGGEALTRKLADQLLSRVANLWNMYGPTETTIWSSVNRIQKSETAITIGEPIGNTELYILDGALQPVPIGVVGELHIGGEGLAEGYLNQEDLTNEKFIRDCFKTGIRARLYKTGDRARYLTNGSIEILGRMDDQVKINGNRVELAEITSILIQHPAVHDSIVITRTETSGKKRLVAYFIRANNSAPSVIELREFLGKKLPPHMIPDLFINIDSFPLTANGKIDRKLLPFPDDVFQTDGYVPPRNNEEKMLSEIWQNVLNLEKVGVNDNFFDLGGASMQSLQVVAKANMYGLRLSVENIFEHQTIAELASCINGRQKSG